jgi:hypothetical protein
MISITSRVRNYWRPHPGPLIAPTLVITEVVYLLSTRLGVSAETRFIADMASGVFNVEPVHRLTGYSSPISSTGTGIYLWALLTRRSWRVLSGLVSTKSLLLTGDTSPSSRRTAH